MIPTMPLDLFQTLQVQLKKIVGIFQSPVQAQAYLMNFFNSNLNLKSNSIRIKNLQTSFVVPLALLFLKVADLAKHIKSMEFQSPPNVTALGYIRQRRKGHLMTASFIHHRFVRFAKQNYKLRGIIQPASFAASNQYNAAL